jgi:hypothetical protein
MTKERPTTIYNRETITAALKSALRSQAFWAAIIFLAAVWLGKPPHQDARLTPDSGSYLGLSAARMPVYPLIASTLGNGYAIIRFQFLLSLASWCWLGWVIARAPGVLLAACFALTVPIVMWVIAVLSESVCLSLMAASLAATIVLFRRWSRWRFAAWCAVVLLFAMTRTTNMFLVPFLVVPFIMAVDKRRLLYVALAALAIVATADLYGRTAGGELRRLSLVNVYTGRILLKPERRNFFAERGMPLKDEMEPYVGKTGKKNMRAIFRACPEFEAWFDDKGESSYYKYILSKPFNYKWPWTALVRNVNFADPAYVDGARARRTYFHLIKFYMAIYVPWWIWLVGLVLPLVTWRTLGRVTPESLLVPALMVATYVQAYVGFHGDRAEVGRHIIPALLLYKVTAVLTLTVVVTAIAERLRARSARRKE